MLAKIPMRSCNVGKFHQERNEYVKKLCHFHCQCDDNHLLFVYTCKDHPFVASRIPEMALRCACTKIGSNNICNFCVQVRYLLNFRTYKICVKKVPLSFQENLVPINEYFENIVNCEPFFYYSPTGKEVDISLDNPSEEYMQYIRKVD